MPMVRENMQAVSVNSAVLAKVGAALATIVQPVPNPLPFPEWQSSIEALGDQLVDVVQMQYTTGERVVDDGPSSPLDDRSFESWPPPNASQHTTKFHVFVPEARPQYTFAQIPYVQIEAASYGWANVMAWAPDGDVAIRLIDTVTAVLREHPAEVDQSFDNNRVFVGHGGDRQWEVVRNYLADAGFSVEAFESDERAGQNTLDVVVQMVSGSRIAVVVMTAADKYADGQFRARQNVIHEIGFAQGALGVYNTIILLEEGTEEFTNIAGLTQIRFHRGEIHTTKDRVLAAALARGYGHGC